MKKPLVYISSPYSQGDQVINARFQCEIWDKLVKENKVLPIAPLWSHFQHLIFPLPYEKWIDYDCELIRAIPFDFLLRLNSMFGKSYKQSKSKGATLEVQTMRLSNPKAKIIIQGKDEPVSHVIYRLYSAMEELNENKI